MLTVFFFKDDPETNCGEIIRSVSLKIFNEIFPKIKEFLIEFWNMYGRLPRKIQGGMSKESKYEYNFEENLEILRITVSGMPAKMCDIFWQKF